MELRLTVAALAGRMHIALCEERMAARTPADLMAGVRSKLTLAFEGGVHVRMTPRAQGKHK